MGSDPDSPYCAIGWTRTIIDDGERNVTPLLSPYLVILDLELLRHNGGGGWIRTNAYRIQSPVS